MFIQNYSEKSIKALFIFILMLGLSLVSLAQEPEFLVPVKAKKYSKIPNPLIRNTAPVDVNVVNGSVYLGGDIYLGSEKDLDRFQNMSFSVIGDENDVMMTGRWAKGLVPFVIEGGFSAEERETLISAMNHIAQKTHVCFINRTTQSDYLRFRKVSEKELGFRGGVSHLGRCTWGCFDGQDIKYSVTVTDRLARHEIGHALGLVHEQNREDRDQSIKILWDNIKPGMESQFAQLPLLTTDVGQYDFNSIMQYRPFAFGKLDSNGNPKQTIRRLSNPSDVSFGNASSYSNRDVAGVNTMYPTECACSTLQTLHPNELEVGQSKTKNVKAKEAYNYMNIYIRQGQKFEFSTESPEWNNGDRETTANGYEGNVLDIGRRHADLKVMALVGEIFNENNNPLAYSGTYLRIGTSRTWTATKTGFLVTFANDCLACYGDNSRIVTLTVKRIE